MASDNGKPTTVDFKNPTEVIALLRQKGAALARGSADDTATFADLAEAVAILMFVTAQGMELSTQPPRPVIKPPTGLHLV